MGAFPPPPPPSPPSPPAPPSMWHPTAPLNVARFGHGVGVLDGVVYVAGGKTKDGGNLTTSVEQFDPAVGKWVNSTHSLPPLPFSPGVEVGRYFLVMAVDEAQGMLWAFGGSNGVQPINNTLFFNGNAPWVESPTFAMMACFSPCTRAAQSVVPMLESCSAPVATTAWFAIWKESRRRLRRV